MVTNPAVYRRRGNEGYVRACMPRLPIALILLAGCTGGRPLSPLSSAGPARDTAGSDSVRVDVAEATRTIERVLDLVGWSDLNELKHTRIPR